VAAAVEEFAAHGYAGTRVVRIAERAGLTHAMLHYYFETKGALYEHVLTTLADPFRTLLVARKLDADQLAEKTFRLFAQNRAYIRIVLWELAAGGGQLERLGLPSVEALEAGLLARLGARVGTEAAQQGVASLLGATLIYFFDDPTIDKLFGKQRFDDRAIDARARHLASLAKRLFATPKAGTR